MVVDKIDVGSLGVISGDNKRVLQRFLGERVFTQRKTYDEFYLTKNDHYLTGLSLLDLHTLSAYFRVEVSGGKVNLSRKYE